MLVAVENDEIVGVGSLDGNKIKKMFVKIGYQRKGIGSELLEKLERIAREKGLEKLTAYSTFSGKGLYEKEGFSDKGKEKREDNGIEFIIFRMIKEL